MPNNDFEGNMSHFILIAPTNKNIMLPKIAFQILGTTKLHLGIQDPGSRKFSCPELYYSSPHLEDMSTPGRHRHP